LNHPEIHASLATQAVLRKNIESQDGKTPPNMEESKETSTEFLSRDMMKFAQKLFYKFCCLCYLITDATF
jgi:hypothetical protein